MNKLIALPIIAAAALGLTACTKTATNENVTITENSANVVDENVTDNAADATLEETNGSNAADAVTNS